MKVLASGADWEADLERLALHIDLEKLYPIPRALTHHLQCSKLQPILIRFMRVVCFFNHNVEGQSQ